MAEIAMNITMQALMEENLIRKTDLYEKHGILDYKEIILMTDNFYGIALTELRRYRLYALYSRKNHDGISEVIMIRSFRDENKAVSAFNALTAV